MEPYRLRIKLGAHEFESEGSEEAVKEQFAIWRELLGSPASQSIVAASPVAPIVTTPIEQDSPPPFVALQVAAPVVSNGGNGAEFSAYDKIFVHRDKLVVLSILPEGESRESDAAMLIMLGRRHYLREELVGGTGIIQGLQQSGMGYLRADRVFGGNLGQYVTRTGQKRAARYRLTQVGISKAKEIAKRLEAIVG